MRIKPKEPLGQGQPVAPPEAESVPLSHGKQGKVPRPRPQRSQAAGGCPLYMPHTAALAADTMCDDVAPPAYLAAREPGDGYTGESGGEDRARHLAMSGAQGHPLLRRLVPKTAAALPPVRPGSRLACQRRCGGAGCDPANSHGCGGVFCLDLQEQL
ncbi:hypothetical protein [Pseudoduganella sp. HUAS MS19]